MSNRRGESMDIILVVYALLVFLVGPLLIIKNVKNYSQNKVRMIATVIIGTLMVISAIFALVTVLN